MTESGI